MQSKVRHSRARRDAAHNARLVRATTRDLAATPYSNICRNSAIRMMVTRILLMHVIH